MDLGYFDKFDPILDEYLPQSEQGNTMATQIVTAANRIIYGWFWNGDMISCFESNDVTSPANWLYDYVPEMRKVLDSYPGQYTIDSKMNEFAKNLADVAFEEKLLSKYKDQPKIDNIYEYSDGGKDRGCFFEMDEPEEDEDDYWDEECDDGFDDDDEEEFEESNKTHKNRLLESVLFDDVYELTQAGRDYLDSDENLPFSKVEKGMKAYDEDGDYCGIVVAKGTLQELKDKGKYDTMGTWDLGEDEADEYFVPEEMWSKDSIAVHDKDSIQCEYCIYPYGSGYDEAYCTGDK